MSDFRPLTGLYRHFLNGLPLINAQIKIKLSVNDYNLEAGYPVEEITVVTTDTGHFPAGTTIWKTARGLNGAKAVFIEPDGFKWEAVVPDGDAPISVQELRANGTVITPPETVLSLIQNTELGQLKNVAFLNLADGDAVVWDAASGKFVNRQISGGGGAGPGVQTANKVYASPDGASGLPVFRALAAGDIPNLSAAKITSGTFGTTRIADNAITFAKLQNISTARILGRSTAGSGSVEEIALGSGLQLLNGILSATGGGGSLSIGAAIGGATAKSLLFADAGGVLAQNNTALSWDNKTAPDGGGVAEQLKIKSGGAEALSVESGESAYINTILKTGSQRYYPIHLFMFNAAYGTNGHFGVTNTHGVTISAEANEVFHRFKSASFEMLAVSDKSGSPTVFITPVRAEQIGLTVQAKSGHTAKLVDYRNAASQNIGGIGKNGGIIPAQTADADAENNTIYYSTDAGRLVYRDANGAVQNISN